MVMEFTLLVEPAQGKLRESNTNHFDYFKYTEIWNLDGRSKNIKLADLQLVEYNFPELLLVDTSYCVKS